MTDASDHLREVQRKAAPLDEAELGVALWKKRGVLHRGRGRTSIQSIRFSLREINAIRADAERLGMTVSAYIRMRLTESATTSMDTSASVTFLLAPANRSWTA